MQIKMLGAIVNVSGRFYVKSKFKYRQNSGFSSQYYGYHREPLTKKHVFPCVCKFAKC